MGTRRSGVLRDQRNRRHGVVSKVNAISSNALSGGCGGTRCHSQQQRSGEVVGEDHPKWQRKANREHAQTNLAEGECHQQRRAMPVPVCRATACAHRNREHREQRPGAMQPVQQRATGIQGSVWGSKMGTCQGFRLAHGGGVTIGHSPTRGQLSAA